MSATTIHFVRHGQVKNPGHVIYERLPGFYLSDQGRAMVEATAHFIAAAPGLRDMAAVYSSPLDRTRETASIILEALNSSRERQGLDPLETIYDRRLIEAGNEFRGKRIGWGEGALWRSSNLKLIRNLYRPSWGESYRHIAHRVADFVYEKIKEYPDQQILAISHESPIWTFRHLLETGHPEHNMLRRGTSLASVTSITFDCSSKRVLGITYADPAASV